MATSTPPAVLALGTRVQVSAGVGVVKFVGQTSFSAGKWVGVELDEPNGKNDGSIGGKRYFTTSEGYGVFVKVSGVRVLRDDRDVVSPSPSPAPTPARTVSRPSSTVSRPPSTTARPAALASSMRALSSSSSGRAGVLSGRSSAASSSRSASPAKPPTKPSLAPSASSTRLVSAAAHTRSSSISQAIASSSLPGPGRLSRPSSPRKPAGVISPSLPAHANFAPPPGTTAILRSPPAAHPRTLVSPTGLRRVVSPALSSTSSRGKGIVSPVAGLGMGMQRQVSGTSSFGAESIMSEELPEEDAVDDDEPEHEPEPGPEPDKVEEKPDPFSLKAVDSRRLAEATVPKREHDELLAKLRILEARRAEDRERLREVDRFKEEAEDWAKIKEKSKAKIVELSGELRELRKQHKELTTERDEFESKLLDLTDQVEISLLDKEVAEERFELADGALEGAKERVAELEVEVVVLREENARMQGAGDEQLREGGDGNRSSLAFIQLEKQNDRLKDALVRLRDLTHETEAENKHRIADLEKELDLTSDLQVIFDNQLVELERAEGQIEDLKQQLDDALGAEDMLEQLTERNLTLSDKIEEMLVAIEDLEALKELNDELEESHVETEKQMQDEIDLKDLLLREQHARADALEDNVVDYEGTVTQFRELVLSLQGDLDQLREHQASQQSESQSLTSQSQAMLNLNLKLQSSVLKGQVKTIELELRKLDAQQAMEHLSIVKPYLLPAFFEDDSDAVDSLLFFERLAHKADLVSMVIEQNHSVTDSLNSVVPEALVAICETRAKLGRFAALNKRFAAQLKRCSPDIFLKMGRVYREVAGTEKRMDAFIDQLRKEELREVECGREVDGFIAQAEHLAELHLQESHLDLAEREQSYIASLDLDFDTIAAAAGFSKQALATIAKDPDVVMDVGDASLDDMLFKPLQQLLNQARSSKVVTKKLLRRLDDLVSNSSALSMEHAQGFETLAYNSSAIASASAKLAADIATYCAEVRTSKHAFQPSTVIALAQEVTATELGKQTPRPLEEISALLAQLSQDVATTLAAALDSDHVVKLSYDPPWVARVAELQSTAAINVDAERKVVKLSEEMRDLVREMRTKDQSFQESAVKIELMEKRMEAVKKQADAISELESELVKSKKQERAYEEAIEALQSDLDAMETELTKLKQTVSAADKQGTANTAQHDGEVVSYEGNMETSRLIEQIDSLRGAVRFLRSENSYLKSQDLLAELEQLPTYAAVPSPAAAAHGIPTRPQQLLTTDPAVFRQSFAAESKLLLREARVLSATPRLVDLSLVKPGGRSAGWQPSARAPESQFLAEKERARTLGRKVERLWAMRPVALSIGAH